MPPAFHGPFTVISSAVLYPQLVISFLVFHEPDASESNIRPVMFSNLFYTMLNNVCGSIETRILFPYQTPSSVSTSASGGARYDGGEIYISVNEIFLITGSLKINSIHLYCERRECWTRLKSTLLNKLKNFQNVATRKPSKSSEILLLCFTDCITKSRQEKSSVV